MNSPMKCEQPCRLTEGGARCELEANLDVLRKLPAFSEVPPQRLKLYAYLCRRVCYRRGEFIFRQGDPDDRGYVLLSGTAQLIREYQDHSVLLNTFHEGEFFGGMALLSDIKRLFSARASTNVECLTLDRESFQKLLVQFPEVGVKILDAMVRRIVQMEEKLLQKHVHECFYG